MLVAHSKNHRSKPTDVGIANILRGVSQERLRAYVDLFAFPRHYLAEKNANIHARDLLLRLLRGFGYTPSLQGTYDNVVITSSAGEEGPFLLLGAHYDSVPGSPGAD